MADSTGEDVHDPSRRDFLYVAAAGQEHPNWEEYDQAVRDDQRSVVIVVPEHVYGLRM